MSDKNVTAFLWFLGGATVTAFLGMIWPIVECVR
jgi:hypothetical protein